MGPEFIASLANKNAFIARSSVSKPLVLRSILAKAIENQIKKNAFSFVEVLSICPTNWKTDAKESFLRLKDMEEYFPVNIFCGGEDEK
jgi:2-oxoglutarate ferredoxin oxidoreductase subunit beta